MIKMNIKPKIDNILRLAWPIDILYNQDQMVGFVMPAVTSSIRIWDIHMSGVAYGRFNINHPITQKVLRVYPNYTWKYSVQISYNLAWIVSYLHTKGVVIGDLSERNLMIDTNTGAVVLIDCNDFDITDQRTGERFPCDVGWPDTLAPELLIGGQLKGRHTQQSDLFSLAIIIFRLLMCSADPFTGIRSADASASMVENTNVDIVNGNCPYVHDCDLMIPPWGLTLDFLPEEILDCFSKNIRLYGC